MDKDLKKVLEALEAQGFDIRLTKSGRLMVTKDGEFVVVLGGNAKDWRGLRNGIAAARRAGFRWPR